MITMQWLWRLRCIYLQASRTDARPSCPCFSERPASTVKKISQISLYMTLCVKFLAIYYTISKEALSLQSCKDFADLFKENENSFLITRNFGFLLRYITLSYVIWLKNGRLSNIDKNIEIWLVKHFDLHLLFKLANIYILYLKIKINLQ